VLSSFFLEEADCGVLANAIFLLRGEGDERGEPGALLLPLPGLEKGLEKGLLWPLPPPPPLPPDDDDKEAVCSLAAKDSEVLPSNL